GVDALGGFGLGLHQGLQLVGGDFAGLLQGVQRDLGNLLALGGQRLDATLHILNNSLETHGSTPHGGKIWRRLNLLQRNKLCNASYRRAGSCQERGPAGRRTAPIRCRLTLSAFHKKKPLPGAGKTGVSGDRKSTRLNSSHANISY